MRKMRLYEEAKATRRESSLEPLVEPLKELAVIGMLVHSISECPLWEVHNG